MFTGVERVLAVGAHPDDVEIGCLGTLLKLGPAVETHVFAGCLGSKGDPSSGPARAEESRNALSCLESLAQFTIREELGIAWADFESIVKTLEGAVRDARPDLIICHGPKDTHQEHRLIWEICMSAARRSRASILHYGTASSTPEFRPNVFVDIREVYERKIEALSAHTSQGTKDYMTRAHMDVVHRLTYASLHGIECCEAFELFRGFL